MSPDPSLSPLVGRAAELRIATLWLDATLCLRAYDPRFSEMFGLSLNALGIGKPLIELVGLPATFRGWVSQAALDIRHPSRWADDRVAAGIAPAMGGGWTVWIVERDALDRDSDRIEEAIAALPNPVFVKDLTGRYVGCNRAFEDYIGLKRHELIGKNAFDVAPSDLAELYRDTDQELLRGERVQSYEATVRYADGSNRQVLFRKSAFFARSGKVAGIVGVMTDISEQKRLEAEYRLAASVFDNAAEAITITDARPAILKVNRAFTEITGYTPEEVVGRNPAILSSGRQDSNFYRNMWAHLAADGNWLGEIVNRRKNGQDYPEWLSISAVRDESGAVANYIGIFTDLSQSKNAEAKIERLSLYDALTELPNRTLFVDRLRQALMVAERRHSEVAVLLIGVEGLRQINDTLGYEVGDQLLRTTAQRLQNVLRNGDTIARYMGDQFVVLLDGLQDAPDAGIVAANVLHALATPVTLQGKDLLVGASIGIAISPRDGVEPSALIRCADVAMHHAKQEGRNVYQFYSSDLEHNTLERLMLESGLRSALSRQEFMLFYQPQIEAQTGTIVGVEALIRWRHPELGMISPLRFIPLAEETGQIIAIGEWVLDTACAQARAWLDAGHPVRVSVNLSARQFRERNIAERVEQALARAGLPAEWLELELTESMVMHDVTRAANALRRLRDLGVKVSIDDFGTGYSSLAYLKRFEIDKLKIDRSFVAEIPFDANDMAIAGAVIALGKSLKLRVVAEGVETQGQLEFLMAQGCHDIQGFYYSRPVEAAAITRLLDNPSPMIGTAVSSATGNT